MWSSVRLGSTLGGPGTWAPGPPLGPRPVGLSPLLVTPHALWGRVSGRNVYEKNPGRVDENDRAQGGDNTGRTHSPTDVPTECPSVSFLKDKIERNGDGERVGRTEELRVTGINLSPDHPAHVTEYGH